MTSGLSNAHPLFGRQAHFAGKVVEVRDELLEDELLSVCRTDKGARPSASSGYAGMRDVEVLEVTGITEDLGTSS